MMSPTQAVNPVIEDRRSISRTLRLSLMVSLSVAALLLGLLAVASSNTKLFESHYAMLLYFTLGVAALLFILVLELVRRLVQRYRRGFFGTKLMARMASIFVAMTVIPVALIFLVAVQFIERSVESWFDLPMERALESGLNLGRRSMDSMSSDLLQKARGMAAILNDQAPDQWSSTLNRLREQAGVQEAMIVTAGNRVIALSGSQLLRLVPDLPPPNAMRQVRLMRQFTAVESGQPKGYNLRAIVVVATDGARPDDARYLQLLQQVPTAISENADAVQQGYRDYQELSLSRAGLKRVFRVTLVLTFLLTLFSAIAGAFLLAGWLTGPLAELASATKAVAEGNYKPLKDYSGRDELGVLTQSFNRMTFQLDDARQQVERNQLALESVNVKLQSVLSNINAGVLVFDNQLCLTLANVGAERILGQDLSPYLGKPIEELPRLQFAAKDIRGAYNESGSESWQRQFELANLPEASKKISSEFGNVAKETKQTLFTRGSLLESIVANAVGNPTEASIAAGSSDGQDPLTLQASGYVLVFDDISELISAQRAVAWAEVARRLAHEIKNPLTPIQLAAERMQMKLRDKLSSTDAEMLDKNTLTIVNQVGALKFMVDEFRDYARLPTANLVLLDLNALIDEVMSLYSDAPIKVELEANLPPILGDTTLLRQVVHNLLKNALEATEKLSAPLVRVTTKQVKLVDGQLAVRMMVRDNGGGFDPSLVSRAFEPYVTSKPRGSGLGLPIVKKIIEEHGARIELSNYEPLPSEMPANSLNASAEPEKTQKIENIGFRGAQITMLFTKLAKNEQNTSLK